MSGSRAAIRTPRVLLASASVVAIAAVALLGAWLAPRGARPWLLGAAGLAVIAAVQSAASDPDDLTAALLLSLPSVVGLVGGGAPSWLVGPFGALLLLAGELNALAWSCEGADQMTVPQRRRLAHVLGLVAFAAVAALAVESLGAK